METPTKTKLLSALRSARHVREPFNYWLLQDVLPTPVCDAIAGLPYAPPSGAVFDGRREANNSTRVYFSPENQRQHEVMQGVADAFRAPDTRRTIETLTGTDLSKGSLRIEYCQDIDGFWLEPHLDISVKLFTMLVYLSDDPALRDAGTDIYDASPEHKLVASAPYEKNKGLIFIPGTDTWHGFTRRPIRGVRKSIIINYVTPDWRARDELA
ncbi:MAG: 2OG-Fe(II) oxygenase [Hyphomicrobiaceae bacterium]|nr:2OG-Fe(II) oxygenase [Hyphomicrobiaceae bacterium]